MNQAGKKVLVVGGGLAGCECALQLARRGIAVDLYEMRPSHPTPVHKTDHLAELVCSNSMKATRIDSAAGLLKDELHRLGSELLVCAEKASVPAGGALAVDRTIFSNEVEKRIAASDLIHVIRKEVSEIPEEPCVIAAGPLCSDALANNLLALVGGEALAFYDAAAPIVDAESLNYDVLFRQSRYADDAEAGDYLNAPFNKEEYEHFIDELLGADRVVARDFETKDLFQACQPVEEVARSGRDAPRFGALKPVGLIDPRTGHRPWAAVQLRAENREQSAYNLVGFQTNLTFGEQKRVFRMIPGLENAEFFRYGVMHRNTFIDAPHVLDETFAIPGTSIRLAGQITGTEGYVEAIASGLLAALNTFADLQGLTRVHLPQTSAFGALVAYATNPNTTDYQPMHVNFGLVPVLEDGKRRSKRDRYRAYSIRAQHDLSKYLAERPELFDVK